MGTEVTRIQSGGADGFQWLWLRLRLAFLLDKTIKIGVCLVMIPVMVAYMAVMVIPATFIVNPLMTFIGWAVRGPHNGWGDGAMTIVLWPLPLAEWFENNEPSLVPESWIPRVVFKKGSNPEQPNKHVLDRSPGVFDGQGYVIGVSQWYDDGEHVTHRSRVFAYVWGRGEHESP